MIFYQSVHGAVHYVSYRESQALGRLLYLLAEVDADVAYYVYWQPRASIGHCIALKELREAVLEHHLYLGDVLVLAEEWSEACEPTVGERSVVHAFET